MKHEYSANSLYVTTALTYTNKRYIFFHEAGFDTVIPVGAKFLIISRTDDLANVLVTFGDERMMVRLRVDNIPHGTIKFVQS